MAGRHGGVNRKLPLLLPLSSLPPLMAEIPFNPWIVAHRVVVMSVRGDLSGVARVRTKKQNEAVSKIYYPYRCRTRAIPTQSPSLLNAANCVSAGGYWRDSELASRQPCSATRRVRPTSKLTSSTIYDQFPPRYPSIVQFSLRHDS
jgi:hypothetical protein